MGEKYVNVDYLFTSRQKLFGAKSFSHLSSPPQSSIALNVSMIGQGQDHAGME